MSGQSASVADPCGLAATMIVRNEARCLARCLDSVRPWVDRMIVVDTGSTDATRDIALAAGAEVHRIAWPNSFALARNHALSLSNADWNLIIDADERIETGGELLRSWTQSAGATLGTVCIHSAFDVARGPGEPQVAQGWITRVLPRGALFEGRVHEQVAGTLPRVRLGLHLSHDGYCDAQLDHKRDRNRPLLLADLGDRPGDPYILYQLGRDAEMRGDPAAASLYYADALVQAPLNAGWRHALVLCQVAALGRLGQLQAALELIACEEPHWPISPDFFFVAGDLYLNCAVADPAGAVNHWLPLACSAWEHCLRIGDQPDLEGSVHGRGSRLARQNLDMVNGQLAQLGRRPAVGA